jgi:hypothetical protein
MGLSPIDEEYEANLVPLTVQARRIPGTGDLELRLILPASKWPLESPEDIVLNAYASERTILIMRSE